MTAIKRWEKKDSHGPVRRYLGTVPAIKWLSVSLAADFGRDSSRVNTNFGYLLNQTVDEKKERKVKEIDRRLEIHEQHTHTYMYSWECEIIV